MALAMNRRCSCPSDAICLVLLLTVLAATEIQAAFHSNAPTRSSFRRRVQRQFEVLSRPSPSLLPLSSSYNNNSQKDVVTPSSSINFAIDPDRDEARSMTARLGLTDTQHLQLTRLAHLVVDWNERINLVSRRDCTVPVVFGRHVLPSIALAAQMTSSDDDWNDKKVVDVGTGGGFPGLPLAIIFPNTQFMLVDSVGKKVKAVEEMANELDLTNVRVHHGRAEEMADDILVGSRHQGAYDVCVGRSVAALPKFCYWIQDLINPESGRLVYIIGGDIEDSLLSQAKNDVAIDDVLEREGASDKRILIFGQEAVADIAAASGEVKRKRGTPKKKVERTSQRAKGQWTKRDNKPKKRGYDNFKRYSTD